MQYRRKDEAHMNRRNALSGLTGALFASCLNRYAAAASDANQECVQWVRSVLKRMESIKPGTTRSDLLRIFKIEGGLSTPLQRTFVSQDCPYFKVDVTFRAVGRPERDTDGRVTPIEDSRDEVKTISRPYLGWSIWD